MAGGITPYPDLGEPNVRRPRHRPDRHQDVAACDGPAIREIDLDAVVDPAGGLGPSPAQHGHSSALEHLLEHPGRVGVLPGQHPVPGGDKRHVRAERLVGAGELGAGDTGADDNQMLGQFPQVVEMAPGENSLAVRYDSRQDSR